jgi:hypothetical protein
VHETASTKVNKLTLELERIPQQIIDKWQTKIDQENKLLENLFIRRKIENGLQRKLL